MPLFRGNQYIEVYLPLFYTQKMYFIENHVTKVSKTNFILSLNKLQIFFLMSSVCVCAHTCACMCMHVCDGRDKCWEIGKRHGFTKQVFPVSLLIIA